MPLGGLDALRRLLWSALVAGAVTGLLLTLVQSVTTVPLIALAEQYENGGAVPQGDRASLQPVVARHGHDGDHHVLDSRHTQDSTHGDWAPDEGIERLGYTALTTALTAFGYALIVVAVLTLTGTAGARAGFIVGLVGLIVFQLAPSLGLPPEPPGVPVTDLPARQFWWIGTAVATALASACWYRARSRSKGLWIPAGAVLLALPHLIGAPHGRMTGAAVVPDELVRRFAAMALLTSAVFWLVLGPLTGYVLGRMRMRET